MAEVGSAFVSVLPSARGFGSSLDRQTSGQIRKSGKKAGSGWGKAFGIAAGFIVAKKAVDFLGASVSEASNLNESLNAVNVTYGKQAGAVKTLGKQAAEALGLSRVEFNDLSVRFSNFAATVAGGDGKKVVGVLDDLTTRAADFASVMNLDVNEAATLFQSGLAGETEPLRKFGIDLSAAKVEAFAYSEGIAKVGDKLTEGEKVQARYKLLMDATKKAAGDFAGTSDGLANKQRILGAEFDNLKAKVGDALLPIITTFVSYLADEAVPKVSEFIDQFKKGTGEGGKWRDRFQEVYDKTKAVLDFIVKHKDEFKTFAATVGVIAVVVKAWAVAQGLLNLALFASPFGIIAVGIIAVGAGFIYAYKHSEKFREKVDALRGFLISHIVPAVYRVKGSFDDLVGALVAVAAWALTLKANMGKALAAVVGFVNQAIAAIRTMPSVFAGVGVDIVLGLINGIKSMAGAAADAAVGVVKGALSAARAALKIGSPSKEFFKLGAWSVDGLILGLSGPEALNKVDRGTDKLVKRLKDKMGAIRDASQSLADSIASAFTSDIFGGSLSDLLTGVSANVAGLQSAQTALGILKSIPGISTAFLSELFQSGNVGLIQSLSTDGDAALAASQLFDLQQTLAQELGASVAGNEFDPQLDAIRKEIELLRADLPWWTDWQSRNFAAAINGAASAAIRNPRGRNGLVYA